MNLRTATALYEGVVDDDLLGGSCTMSVFRWWRRWKRWRSTARCGFCRQRQWKKLMLLDQMFGWFCDAVHRDAYLIELQEESQFYKGLD